MLNVCYNLLFWRTSECKSNPDMQYNKISQEGVLVIKINTSYAYSSVIGQCHHHGRSENTSSKQIYSPTSNVQSISVCTIAHGHLTCVAVAKTLHIL